MSGKTVIGIIPLHESKRPIIHHVIENLGLQDRRCTMLLLINNSSYEFVKYVHELTAKYRSDNVKFIVSDLGEITYKHLHEIYSYVVNTGYGYADHAGYDFACVIGADILMPFTAISELLAVWDQRKKTGVACLTCYFRTPGIPEPVPMVLPRIKFGRKSGSLNKNQYFAKKYLLVEAGNGAMMAPRSVYSKVKWRVQIPNIKTGFGADYQFCIDVREKLKRSCIIVTDLEVSHIDNDGTLYNSRSKPAGSEVLDSIEAKNAESQRKSKIRNNRQQRKRKK